VVESPHRRPHVHRSMREIADGSPQVTADDSLIFASVDENVRDERSIHLQIRPELDAVIASDSFDQFERRLVTDEDVLVRSTAATTSGRSRSAFGHSERNRRYSSSAVAASCRLSANWPSR
jgi:hypothetical protein